MSLNPVEEFHTVIFHNLAKQILNSEVILFLEHGCIVFR